LTDSILEELAIIVIQNNRVLSIRMILPLGILDWGASFLPWIPGFGHISDTGKGLLWSWLGLLMILNELKIFV